VTAAREVPGVAAVLTAHDLAGVVKPMRAIARTPAYRPCDTPILARDKVRMVGEPVALVLAADRYRAEDGVAAVALKLAPLPALLTMDDALAAAPRRSTPMRPRTSSTASSSRSATSQGRSSRRMR
jgi:CO/xanthine dehydrogenase Mo-binding subunit